MNETNYSTKKIFLIALVVYVIAAIFSLGNHHPDEHFQIFEFAALKLGMTFENNLPWEYHFQMRPALQPAMVVVLHRFLAFFGLDNPFFVAFLFRLGSAFLSLYTIKLVIDLYKNQLKHQKIKFWFVVLSLFIWISLYNNVRFSSENWSGNLFVIGFVWIMQAKKPKTWTYLLAGALFGLSFVIRYQVAFMVLGFGMWLLIQRKDPFGKLVLMALAFFAMFGLGVVIDKWYYGEWVLTTWNYLKWNILADRVSTFGVEPWYYYITQTVADGIPPFSIMYVLGFLWFIFKRPKSAITWTIVPFLLIHFLIGHKETRFMFPIIGFMPVVIAFFLDHLMTRYGDDFFRKNSWAYWGKRIFWIANVVMVVIVMFRPANNRIRKFKAFYKAIDGPATVYYDGRSPFGDEIVYNYYMKPDLEVLPLELLENSSPSDRQVFIATSEKEVVNEYIDKTKLIYQSYPEWVRKYDFNDWVSRTSFFYILELDHPDEN